MLQVKKKHFKDFLSIFVGLQLDLSTLDVSFDPKMTKKYFREDSHAIVQNFKEIKNYVGTYSIITSPVYEPNP